MTYKKIPLKLVNSLSFWTAFPDQERAFVCDQQSDKILIGAGHVTENPMEAPYQFYHRKFFGQASLTAFEHYYDGEFYWYLNEPAQIKEMKILSVKHEPYQISNDSKASWRQVFEQIQAAKLEKVVLSRQIDFESTRDFNIESILQKLSENNPNCFIFAYENRLGNVFLGASPEFLVKKSGSEVTSMALAGTAPVGQEDFLLKDPKNREEQAIVVRAIAELLAPATVEATKILALKNIVHLQSLIHTESDASLVDWADRLHPTPAMGGNPREAALKLLQKVESHDRGLYASPLGFIDQKGDGLLLVGIRSALIRRNRLSAYVGCGLIKESDCQTEYEETQVKLQTIMEAL